MSSCYYCHVGVVHFCSRVNFFFEITFSSLAWSLDDVIWLAISVETTHSLSSINQLNLTDSRNLQLIQLQQPAEPGTAQADPTNWLSFAIALEDWLGDLKFVTRAHYECFKYCNVSQIITTDEQEQMEMKIYHRIVVQLALTE